MRCLEVQSREWEREWKWNYNGRNSIFESYFFFSLFFLLAPRFTWYFHFFFYFYNCFKCELYFHFLLCLTIFILLIPPHAVVERITRSSSNNDKENKIFYFFSFLSFPLSFRKTKASVCNGELNFNLTEVIFEAPVFHLAAMAAVDFHWDA